MTNEQIIELAKQAGFEVLDCGNGHFVVVDAQAGESAIVRYTELLLASPKKEVTP